MVAGSTDVLIYQIPGHQRSATVCRAMFNGIAATGDSVSIVSPFNYRGIPKSRVAVFYGLQGRLARLFKDYVQAGRTAVYIDLGYWQRKPEGKRRFEGFHKIVINDRHATAYFQKVAHPADRIEALGIRAAPWRSPGSKILVAGMGPKGARFEGFEPRAWEKQTIAELRRHTKRPIIYRPKPNWPSAKPIEGALFDAPGATSLDRLFEDTHAAVVWHSNVAIDALVAGVPIFAHHGAASVLGLSDLSQIEQPIRPDGREQWLADLAYTQWSVEEMDRGLPWRHLKAEGLVP